MYAIPNAIKYHVTRYHRSVPALQAKQFGRSTLSWHCLRLPFAPSLWSPTLMLAECPCNVSMQYVCVLSMHCPDADWTASGRSLDSIERFMRHEVLPWYGNTHTTSSATGARTGAFREEARRIIADSVNAKVCHISSDPMLLPLLRLILSI